MSFRSDIEIDWGVSPRLVKITSASDLLTIQDAYDTLRILAAYAEAMDDPEIVDAGGKEGGIVAVTMTLKNAQVKFKDTGTPRLCKVTGGNLFAVDENGQNMAPVAYTPNVTVAYAQSTAAALVADVAEWTASEKAQTIEDVAYVKAKTPASLRIA